MDSRFVPRTNEEMLKAVNDFKKRQQKMYSRLSSKLEISFSPVLALVQHL